MKKILISCPPFLISIIGLIFLLKGPYQINVVEFFIIPSFQFVLPLFVVSSLNYLYAWKIRYIWLPIIPILISSSFISLLLSDWPATKMGYVQDNYENLFVIESAVHIFFWPCLVFMFCIYLYCVFLACLQALLIAVVDP